MPYLEANLDKLLAAGAKLAGDGKTALGTRSFSSTPAVATRPGASSPMILSPRPVFRGRSTSRADAKRFSTTGA